MNRNNTKKHRVAIAHPCLSGMGGSESKVMWITEALKKDYSVTLMTMGDVNLNLLNKYYSTAIQRNEIEIVSFPIPALLRRRFDALRGFRLARYCHAHAEDFDIMISAYNVMDFGKRGIQYISDFSFDDRIRQRLHPVQVGFKGIFYKRTFLRDAYLLFNRLLSGASNRGWQLNLTIANSEWSASILKEEFHLDTRIIYPPVIVSSEPPSWETRQIGFVALGRISPEKRIENVVAILERVRNKGHDVHLHVLGGLDNSSYSRRISRLASNRSWLILEGMAVGGEKDRLIGQHKFGISGCENEAFGIAVAEMARMGCLVWVPDSGGQVEIVRLPELVYRDIDDAVEKIDVILRSESTQARLKRRIFDDAKEFSTERFIAEIRNLVREFIAEPALHH